jgi:hypothetical protein
MVQKQNSWDMELHAAKGQKYQQGFGTLLEPVGEKKHRIQNWKGGS